MIGRRGLLGGLLAMTWGDRTQGAGTGRQPAPMNRPPAQPLSIGVQPGVPNVIRAREVIISGAAPPPSTGLFVYGPTGTLIGWIVGAPGFDPVHHQAVTTGITSSDGTTTVQLFGSEIKWDKPSDPANTDPTITTTVSGASGNILTVSSGTGVIAGNSASLAFEDATQAAATGLVPAGQALVFVPLTTTILSDGWHSLGSPSATGYNSNLGAYRQQTDGLVAFRIALVAQAGGGTAGVYTYANALAAGYRPNRNWAMPLGYNGTIAAGQNFPSLRVDTAGNVTLQIPGLPATSNITAVCLMDLN